MNTNEMLALLEVHADGMNRDGTNGLLFFLNTAQNILTLQPAEQNIVFGTDGRLPSFNTVDGTYVYEAPAEIWRVEGVYIEGNVTNRLIEEFIYRNFDYGVYGSNYRTGVRELERRTITGIEYFRTPYVRTQDASDTGRATATFTENPGATTAEYRWYGLRRDTAIVSDSIPLTVKPPYDYMYLLPATLLLIQGFKDGDFLNKHAEVLALAKKYQLELNKGEQGEFNGSIERGF